MSTEPEPGDDGTEAASLATEGDDRADDLANADGTTPVLDGFEVDRVEMARRRHGGAGGVLAAAMLGLDQALHRKPKEEIPVVVASNSDPEDIDHQGIVIPVDEATSVVAPPQPRGRPVEERRRVRGKRRRPTR